MYKNVSVKCPHCKKLVVSGPTHRPNWFGAATATVGTHTLDRGGVCPGSGAYPKQR